MAHRQQANTFKLAFVTALNDGTDINSSDTTVTVDDATGIQVGAYIRLESEIMKVTAVSTNDLTVTRGVLGTTAASHAAACSERLADWVTVSRSGEVHERVRGGEAKQP